MYNSPCCFGSYVGAETYGCWDCCYAPSCKYKTEEIKNRKDDTINMTVVKITKTEETQGKKALSLKELRENEMSLTAKRRELEEEILAESLSKNFDCNRYQILRLQYVKTNQAIEEVKTKITDKETENQLMKEYQSLLKDYELVKYQQMAAHMSGNCIREYNLGKNVGDIGRALFEAECKLRELCKRKFTKDEQK